MFIDASDINLTSCVVHGLSSVLGESVGSMDLKCDLQIGVGDLLGLQ